MRFFNLNAIEKKKKKKYIGFPVGILGIIYFFLCVIKFFLNFLFYGLVLEILAKSKMQVIFDFPRKLHFPLLNLTMDIISFLLLLAIQSTNVLSRVCSDEYHQDYYHFAFLFLFLLLFSNVKLLLPGSLKREAILD